MSTLIGPTRVEVINVVKVLPSTKVPGHDRICHTSLKALPMRELPFITLNFNAKSRTQLGNTPESPEYPRDDAALLKKTAFDVCPQ